ncbi:cytochrome C oxidase-assembly factor, mitochondrial precursor [Suhomyces tanzawaensis NRRL Y-17324]|uniref:Cytochrome c oxidase-assembly factor COX23, mitochondrial n=1 Tax=Suhomyces tanzawaensis NRRL Y-17324 TaxID=984487 RepID=A0A1E4SK81_9ASCO|nr:cytochrome C oxidase-assembly factor, mitochondrial precursor [Suhomyces tanzawaensis NRRL Y-17324]ODV79900.1 cytochrome C oxidase-assembly factor, mitochondrial precursor [Suhomyces tanzawaensis NRRL Y-17324]
MSSETPEATPSPDTSKSVDTPKRTEAPIKLESDEVVKDLDKVDFTQGGVDKFKFYPDNPENHRHKYRWSMKGASKFYDPCEESRQASMNCLLRNPDDRTVCQDFFDAYKECKKDFFAKKKQDKREGKKGWGFW